MLYIVATPIGNLEDISARALRILREVDFILAEDTRVSRKLLDRFKINTKVISYFQHSRDSKIDYIIDLLKQDRKLALITDAGTPGISDPGNKLVARVVSVFGSGVKIEPIPGPSAVTTALSISGLPADRFLFMGFVPHKKGRKKFLAQILAERNTVVFFESKYRILKTLQSLKQLSADILSQDKFFVVCRELTKSFENIYRGFIDQVLIKVSADPVKGEYVIVVGSGVEYKSEINNS